MQKHWKQVFGPLKKHSAFPIMCYISVSHLPIITFDPWPALDLYGYSGCGYQVIVEGEFLGPLVQFAGLPLPFLPLLSILSRDPVLIKVIIWLLGHCCRLTRVQEFTPLLKGNIAWQLQPCRPVFFILKWERWNWTTTK